MTRDEIEQLLKQHVRYQDWVFHVGQGDARDLYLQLMFRDGGGAMWNGRKWRLSEHMTRGEIVQTALKAVLTAVEHEAREQFLYRDKPIFGPHFDVDQLVELCDQGDALDVRVPVTNWSQL